MDTSLDISALVTGLAWPAVVGALAWWYRAPLAKLITEAPRYVKSFKLGAVEVQFAEAKPASLSMIQGAVDLRHAGTPNDVNDSTLASFYAQVADPTRMDYVVVDVGTGSDWLSSRLYILSVIMRRMRGLRAIVFVESNASVRRKLVGVCECEPVRWLLAARWPRFESALAAAELNVWGHPYDLPSPIPGTVASIVIPRAAGSPVQNIPPFSKDRGFRIANAEGRLEGCQRGSPEGAALLLKSFLDAIQRPIQAESDDWQVLGSTPSIAEYAVWLTGTLIDQILVGSLEKRSVRLHDYQGWNEQLRVRAFLEHPFDWVAVTREDGVFDRLINRREMLEQLALQVAKGASG